LRVGRIDLIERDEFDARCVRHGIELHRIFKFPRWDMHAPSPCAGKVEIGVISAGPPQPFVDSPGEEGRVGAR
jgi:hypothetical protein